MRRVRNVLFSSILEGFSSCLQFQKTYNIIMKRNILAVVEDTSGNQFKIVENYKSDWERELVIHTKINVLSREQEKEHRPARGSTKIRFKSSQEKQYWVDQIRSKEFEDFIESPLAAAPGKYKTFMISLPPYKRHGGTLYNSNEDNFYFIGKSGNYTRPRCWLADPKETLNQVANVLDSYN